MRISCSITGGSGQEGPHRVRQIMDVPCLNQNRTVSVKLIDQTFSGGKAKGSRSHLDAVI